MKKTIIVITAIMLILSFAAGCEQKKGIELPVHVEGSIFGGSSTDNMGLELKFDPKWITAGDNTSYNKELAAFSAIFSADTYFRTKDLDRGTPNRVIVDGADIEAYDWTVLLTTLGFSDVQYIESFKAETYENDQNDSVTLTLGYYNDRNKNDCFAIAVRGCFSSAEWNSIFDVGSADEVYSELTGEHPEWTDTDLMKGLGIAANRAMDLIDSFIASHDDPSRKNCVLVTGHSRGGAIAEIIGASFEDDPAVKSVTYAFNSSPVTENAGAEKYRTVFNILDSADYFADCLPFKNEEFYRYGRTMSIEIAENDKVRDAIVGFKGADDYRCLKKEAAAEYRDLFGQLFPDRASLYEQYEITRAFDTESAALEELEQCRSSISAETGFGLEAFCSVTDLIKNDEGKYEFSILYCRAALLQSIGRTLAYGQTACDAVHLLFGEEEGICAIADLIMANAADITGGHRLLNSYVLTGFLKS